MATATTTTTTTSLSPPSLSSLSLFYPTTQLRLPFLLSKPISLSSRKTPLLRHLPCTPSDDLSPVEDSEVDSSDPPQLGSYTPTVYFDDGPEETEEEVGAAYEKLYGQGHTGKSFLGRPVIIPEEINPFNMPQPRRPKDGLEERVLEVRRVQKVVKGGTLLSFRVTVIVGDMKGHVGIGVAQAKDSIGAVTKAIADARRKLITVPMTRHKTFPHRANGKYGAAVVMLRPCSPGSGVSAGGTVRLVLEMAGVQNARGKQLRSDNAMNNAKACVEAMRSMRTLHDVAAERGIPVERLMWSYKG